MKHMWGGRAAAVAPAVVVAVAAWGGSLFALSGCGDEDEASVGPVTVTLVGEAPAESEAGQALSPTVRVEARDAAGELRAGVALTLRVVRGGGTLAATEVETGADGTAELPWTLGVAPVRNTVEVTGGEAPLEISVDAVRTEPLVAEPFGDVHAFLEAEGVTGTTEDLAFDGDDTLVLGVPGGLVALDASGNAVALELTGDPLVGPLGIAYDAEGTLWVADAEGQALRAVSPEGVVTTVLTDDGRPGDDVSPLEAPNYVAFDAEGRLYLTDPCLGEVIRLDPASGAVDAWLDFDLATEGGPNGLAFDAAGRLTIATENTGLLCGHDFVNLIEEIAGVYRVAVDGAGFGERETLVASGGLFGDGLAYDAEGNLYVIFDTQANLELEESAVYVLRSGETELRRLVSASDQLFANLAFGRGAFGETTLYLAMLVIEPFVAPETRGVTRVEVGIRGLLQ